MSFETTRCLLEHIKDYHRQLGVLYSQTADSTEQQKVKMLLHYLGRHELKFDKILVECESEASSNVLDTWFSFTPEKLPKLDNTKLEPDMTVDEVMQAALRFDDIIITFCRQVTDEAVSNDVSELFNSLMRLEENEERAILRASTEI